MWVLWLVPGSPEALLQQAACQPASSWPQIIWKSSPFCKRTPLNVRLYSSSQQANLDLDSVLHHHTAQIHWQYHSNSAQHHHIVQQQWDHMLEGSAQLPLGDTRGGIKDQEWFLQRLDNSNNEWTQRFLPKKSGHWQNEGEADQDDGREPVTLCSEQFVVPGAQNIIRMLGAPNFV